MGLIEWWSGLSPWVRYGVALFFLAISTALYFAADRFWPWGWAVGGVLLLFSGRSESERRGGF